MRWHALGLVLALFAFSTASAHALEVEVLRQSGPVDKRFNLVVLGDGYRASDQAQLSSDAKKLIDYVFGVSPFQEYAGFFNIKLVHVISNDNGGDNGAYGANRDTALGSYFDCDGTPRLLCVDDGKVQAAAAASVPEFNFAIVIVNDTTYGGSGGTNPATSINDQSFEIVAHEIGHSMAALADEYETPNPGYPTCSQTKDCSEGNVTLRSTRDGTKWLDWIDEATPVPTPETAQYASAVGLYQGARYLSTGMYRPWQECKMRDLGNPYCPVCREQFVLHYWNFENIKMIEDSAPASPLAISDCKPVTLSVTSPPLTPSTYAYSWTIDDQPQPGTSSQFTLLPASLGQGAHTVAVVTLDKTSYVRTDPNQLLQDRAAWSVTVATDGCSAVGGSSGAGGGGASNAGGSGGAPALGGAPSSAGAAGSSVGSGAGGASAASNGGSAALGEAGSAASGHPPPPEETTCRCGVVGGAREHGAAPLGVLLLGLGALGCQRRRSKRDAEGSVARGRGA